MGIGVNTVTFDAQLHLALASSSGLLLWAGIWVETVYGHTTLGGVLLDNAVNLGLGVWGNGGAVDGSHGGISDVRRV